MLAETRDIYLLRLCWDPRFLSHLKYFKKLILYYFRPMLSIEASLLAAHMGLSCLSIILSILLVYVVFRYTPASFATFAVMLKCHALIDLYVAVGSSSSMQRYGFICFPLMYSILHIKFFKLCRVIPVNWSIIIISYGPCVYVGSTACYVSCTIFFGGQSFFVRQFQYK